MTATFAAALVVAVSCALVRTTGRRARFAFHVLYGRPLVYRTHSGPLVFGPDMQRLIVADCFIDGALDGKGAALTYLSEAPHLGRSPDA